MNTKLFIFQIPAQIFICSNSFLYCFPDLLQKLLIESFGQKTVGYLNPEEGQWA